MARSMTAPIDQLDDALAATGKALAALSPVDWSRPSLCEGWTVRDEANHLVRGLRIFTAMIRGEQPPGDHNAHDWLGDDPVASYDAAAAEDAVAWRSPSDAEMTFDLSFAVVPGPLAAVIHLTEVVVHGLDIAVATGHENLLDDRSAEELLAAMHGMGGIDDFRQPTIFGPETPIAAAEPSYRRLLAYLGRTGTNSR
jgi:uncharacterized protein (TIGR03086 family)